MSRPSSRGQDTRGGEEANFGWRLPGWQSKNKTRCARQARTCPIAESSSRDEASSRNEGESVARSLTATRSEQADCEFDEPHADSKHQALGNQIRPRRAPRARALRFDSRTSNDFSSGTRGANPLACPTLRVVSSKPAQVGVALNEKGSRLRPVTSFVATWYQVGRMRLLGVSGSPCGHSSWRSAVGATNARTSRAREVVIHDWRAGRMRLLGPAVEMRR